MPETKSPRNGAGSEEIIETVRRVLKVLLNIVVYGFCFSYLYPFIWLLINSFKDRAQFAVDTFNFPTKATLYAYNVIFSKPEVYRAAFNSIFNTGVSLIFIVGFSYVIGYFLSRYMFKGRNILYAFFLLGMVIPGSTLIIPLYILFNRFGLINTYFTLIFPYITFSLPLSIFLYDSYMRTISRSIEEAAFVDGATINQIMVRVMFPICRPITGTVLIFNFMGLWNEFQLALILNSAPPFRTIPVWLTNFQGMYSSDMPVRITAMLIGSLPIILTYLFFREKMMEGMAAGAIKG